MENETPYGETRYEKNADGCDIHFNENNEELIPVNLMLTKSEIQTIMLLIRKIYTQTTDRKTYYRIAEKLETYLD